jgi:hypothetical protein
LATLIVDGLDEDREQAARRLAEFRRRTAGRGLSPSAIILEESREARMDMLTGQVIAPDANREWAKR